MSYYKNFSFLFIAVIALTSCLKDSVLPKKFAPIEISTGIPVVNSKMTIANATDQNDSTYHLSINSEGYYSFIFTPHTQKFPKAEDFIVLQDLEMFNKYISSRPSITIPGINPFQFPTQNYGPYVVTFTGLGNDQLKGAQLKEITYKGGSLSMTLHSEYNDAIELQVVFKSLVKDSLPFTLDFTLDPSSGDQTSSKPLAGYVLNLTGGKDDTTSNQFVYDIEITKINRLGSSSNPTQFVYVSDLIFKDQLWSKIVGKLSSVEIPVTADADPLNVASNAITLLPFANNDNADPVDKPKIDFVFIDPNMHGPLYNGFGLPITLSVKPVKAIDINGNTLDSSSTLDGNSVILPGLKSDTIKISGPAFGNLFEKGPKELDYSMYMSVDGTKTKQSDFMYDTSRISTNLIVELPLHGTFSLFNLKSITENPLYQNSDSIPIFDPEDAEVRFAYKNAMPIGFTLQVYFMDANNHYVPTINANGQSDTLKLFDTGNAVKAAGASVGSDGFVNDTISTYTSPLKQILTIEQFTKIKAAPKLQYVARMNSTDINVSNPPVVKIRPKDYIVIRLSAGVDGTVNLNNIQK